MWVGWAERSPGGVGGRLNSEMELPPLHHDIHTPTNIVYSIPMRTIFGSDIPIPPGLPPALTIDTDIIRETILSEI
jgi:hypothetical protein